MYGFRSINYHIVKAVFSSSLSFFLSLSSKFPVSSFFSPVYVPPYSSYAFHLSTTPPIWKVLKVHCPIIQIFNEGIKQYFFPVPNPKGVHEYTTTSWTLCHWTSPCGPDIFSQALSSTPAYLISYIWLWVYYGRLFQKPYYGDKQHPLLFPCHLITESNQLFSSMLYWHFNCFVFDFVERKQCK